MSFDYMSQFPQPQHIFAAARDSGTFGSIIEDPYMVTLDPPFYIWEIHAWKEKFFNCSGSPTQFFHGSWTLWTWGILIFDDILGRGILIQSLPLLLGPGGGGGIGNINKNDKKI